MTLKAFLKIDDIEGESQTVGHEDEIVITGLNWSLAQIAAATARRGRARARTTVEPLVLSKHTDAATAELVLACLQARSFPEMVLTVTRDTAGAPIDYLVLTLENVVISSFDMKEHDTAPGAITEQVGLRFQRITIRYTRTTDDGDAGDAYEITYDLSAGA